MKEFIEHLNYFFANVCGPVQPRQYVWEDITTALTTQRCYVSADESKDGPSYLDNNGEKIMLIQLIIEVKSPICDHKLWAMTLEGSTDWLISKPAVARLKKDKEAMAALVRALGHYVKHLHA